MWSVTVQQVNALYTTKMRALKTKAGASGQAGLHQLYVGMLVTGFVSAAMAQNVDAGRIYDSLQKRQPAAQQPPQASVNIPSETVPVNPAPDPGVQVDIKEFRIEGVRLLALPKLEALVKPYTNRKLTVVQLQEAADLVTQAYRDAGYLLARAAVLPQPLADGVVTITVREGNLERLKVDAKTQRKPPGIAQTGLQQSQRLGDPVNIFTLEETLLRIHNLPGAGRASAEIVPASQGDSSEVNVLYVPAPRVSGSVQADNNGNRYTGRPRLFGSLAVNEPLGGGDQFSLAALSTGQLLTYAQMAYRVPVNLSTTVGLSASTLRYDQCCQAPGPDANGRANDVSFELAYAMLVRRNQQAALFASADQRRLQSGLNSVNQTDRKIKALTLGGRGYWSGNDATLNSWSLAVRGGRADLSKNVSDDIADASGAQVQGDFSKLVGSYYRSQAVGSRWVWLINLRGQTSLGRNLESSERFALGGADGVRAYPSGEGVGDSGLLASAELRYAVSSFQGLSLAGFMDAGGIKRLSKNATVLATSVPNDYALAGLGVGARYELAQASILLSVAQPVGRNRGVDAAGNNNEGRRDGGTQAWVNAAFRF